MDQIYDSARSHGMNPVVELDGMPAALCQGTPVDVFWYNGAPLISNPPNNYNKWEILVDSTVTHLEQRYGANEVRTWYFEVWNEPNLNSISQAQYMEIYDYASEGVRLADSLCQIGGPIVSGGGSGTSYGPLWISAWLNHVINGTNTATGLKGSKADFLDYHRYANDTNFSSGTSAPVSMNKYHMAIVDTARKYGFTKPIICSEYGPTYVQTAVHNDRESSASFIVKTLHMLLDNGANYPPPLMYSFWTLSDIFEEENKWSGSKPMAYESGGSYGMLTIGDSVVPNSWDLEKPSFNAYKLLHKMTDTRISLAGGTTGNGVNGVATMSSDKNSIQVLIYDHVDGGTASSTAADTVTLSVSGIPFGTNSANENFILIDSSHSNSYRVWQSMGSPVQPSASQYAQLTAASQLSYIDSAMPVTLTNNTFSAKFTFKQYSVALISLANPTAAGIVPLPRTEMRPEPSIAITAGYIVIKNTSTMPSPVKFYSMSGRLCYSVTVEANGTKRVAMKNLPAVCIATMRTGGRMMMSRTLMVSP